MGIETEVKIRVDSIKLEEITGFLGRPKYFNQTNLIYQNSHGFLRLRKEKGNTVVTYKGFRMNDKFGSREEIELSLAGEEQFELLRLMLEKMGMAETLYYDKERAEFNFGLCKVFLDSTAKGDFVEIEARDTRDIEKAMAFFGLKQKDIEKRSYLELLRQENEGGKNRDCYCRGS